jgi:hypothetical protein
MNQKMDTQNSNITDTTLRQQEEIRLRAENLMIRTQMLIDLCDSWLPADVANENLFREIREREKKKRRNAARLRWRKFTHFLRRWMQNTPIWGLWVIFLTATFVAKFHEA